MSFPAGTTLASLDFEPLSVPLREPFVIATGRMDATRAVWVRVTLVDGAGRSACGFGEAAALPPVTWEDQPDLLALLARAAPLLAGRALDGGAATATLTVLLDETFPRSAVARAGVESAILDAGARLEGQPLSRWLCGGGGGEALSPTAALITDITLPIGAPDHLASLARAHRARGFTHFKVKVGRDWRADLQALRAVVAAVPDAGFRLDANAGFSAGDASALLESALSAGMTIECFEQPCARDDLAGMAELTARSPVPIVADESFRGGDDLERLARERAASGVNLKLAKLGGPLAALALARRARALGLRLMAGAMVETRLGLLAMAHVVAALGGVDWVDLDTAFLLADEPFSGGWVAEGARLTLTGGAGLDVRASDRARPDGVSVAPPAAR